MFEQRMSKQIIAVLIFWELVGSKRDLGMEIKIRTERIV